MEPRLRVPSEDALAVEGRLGRAFEALELVVEIRVDADPRELREGQQAEDPGAVDIRDPREHDVKVRALELAVGGLAQVQQGPLGRVALGREVRDAGTERPVWRAALTPSKGHMGGRREFNCPRRASRHR